MGNKGQKGHVEMKETSSWLQLNESERNEIINYFNKFVNENDKVFNIDCCLKDSFMILSDVVKGNLISFLNSYYEYKHMKRQLQQNEQFEIADLIVLGHVLMKANSDYDDEIYYHKNTFLILYDIIKGKVKSYEDNKNDIHIDDLLLLFNFTTMIYFNKYTSRSTKMKNDIEHNPFTDEFNTEMRTFIYSNIIPQNEINTSQTQQITLDLLIEFIDNKLYALDGFLRTHFQSHFFNKITSLDDSLYINPFPLFNDPPSTISNYQFFYYCLTNTNISSHPYAFKLYDCKVQGYNLPNLIYSFMGFTGPIIILTQHYDDKNDKIISLGMYINSNFKECYEKFCGDDLSHIFTFEPKLTIYKSTGDDKDNYCFIASKSQKFSKSKPGIGMGYRSGEIRFWLDATELFSKSHFCKYDNVFEEGTPFNGELKEMLNIGNIEVFGFGDEDALESLMKKQERDKNVIDKMKKVDKSAFVNNEFDKEMFFGKTFSHRQNVDERGADVKKEE